MSNPLLIVARTAVVAAAVLVQPAQPRAGDDGLADVLARAGEYATQFRKQLSGIVAEETYIQNVRTTFGVNITLDGRGTEPVKHRELRSDFLMVRAGDRYAEFRDVFSVDGTPVRDRQDRLTRLFLRPGTSRDQIVRIAEESARYNVGSVFRNINTPALALIVIEPEQQARFKFRKVDPAAPTLSTGWPDKSTVEFTAPSSAWVIQYQEVRKDTLIKRQGGNGDLFSQGRLWIEPESGRVLLTELVVGDPLMQCTIDVRYAASPALGGALVPAEMRERYVNTRDRATTIGTATYGNVRRFGVQTDEDIPVVH